VEGDKEIEGKYYPLLPTTRTKNVLFVDSKINSFESRRSSISKKTLSGNTLL
jgi:hypothetical protein